MRILLAEADAPLAESLRQHFKQEHCAVHLAGSGDEVQALAANEAYDFLVLGLELPTRSDFELLRRMNSKNPEVAIVVLAQASAVEDRIRALDCGADDYLLKPVAVAEVAARIRAVSRRNTRLASAVLTVGDLALDRIGHTVKRCGRVVELSPREFALLEYLMRHAGQPVTRSAIVEDVWKLDFKATTNVVDVYVNYLRRKVDKGYDQALIRTIRGVGYQIGINGVHS
jgi:DNA-binding response OmpR family regulator